MNPNAAAFWIFCTCVGFLIGGPTGALTGFTVGLGLSLAVTLL